MIIEQALQAAEALSTSRASKYDELFTSDELAKLEQFTTWLVDVCEFKSTSASSYRANFSRACEKLSKDEKLNSDERSALRKFVEFVDSAKVTDEVVVEDDES